MNILRKNDYLEVKLNSLIADYDRETLTMLYQPIIGYTALSVYFSLWSEGNMQRFSSMIIHEQFFNRLHISCGSFVEARKMLEATGLVRSYLSKADDVSVYHYEIYAPKTPFKFFEDTLLFGMLIKILGEKEANKLKSMFKIEVSPVEGNEISSNFQDVFMPCYDDPSFLEAASSNNSSTYSRNVAKVRSEFSYEKFFDYLEDISHITPNCLFKREVKEIERLSMLYGVREQEAANAITYVYNADEAKGKRIDFEKLNYYLQNEVNYSFMKAKTYSSGPNIISGKSDLATKINLMETVSPKDFMSILQNGSKIASADMRIINSLSKDFNLSNSVINAVIDYVLTTNDNIFSRALAEKVAGSLARENIDTTIDAMNYLKKCSMPKRGRKKNVEIYNTKSKVMSSRETKEQEDLEWEALIDSLEEGDSDGKA